MGEPISISKNVVSKLALLHACMESSSTYSIEETDTHWILTSSKEHKLETLQELFRMCMEKEVQLALEASVAPLREILYRKAFESIAQRK